MLVAEQQADSTLKHALELTKKGEKGYSFEDKKILVQCASDSLGDCKQRVVVSRGRRLQVLKLAHSSLQAGHFGVKKTFARVSLHFLWPRMWGDVKQFVQVASVQPETVIPEPHCSHCLALASPLKRSPLIW